MRVPLPVVVVVVCLGLPSVYGVFGSTSSNMHFLKIIKHHIVCRISPAEDLEQFPVTLPRVFNNKNDN